MVEKKIETYNVWTEGEILDKQAMRYYAKRGIHTKLSKKKLTKNNEHISVFGENIVKFKIPEHIDTKINKIYRKAKKIEDMDIKRTIDLYKEECEIELVIIKDQTLADKMKEAIINNFDKEK